MAVLSLFISVLVLIPLVASQGHVSSIAGSTQTFEFPPPGISTVVNPDPNFSNGSDVGFAGPTPSDIFFLLEKQISRN